jgi:hypothetical protein
MKNIWTQHLERSNSDDQISENTFSQMLHSLVKTENNDYLQENNNIDDFDIIDEIKVSESNKEETEVCTWTAESHKGYELGIESLEKDSVRLIMTAKGSLFLRYDVAGESPFEMAVKSEDEAMKIIEEDNATTEQLYPDNYELKWIKIN